MNVSIEGRAVTTPTLKPLRECAYAAAPRVIATPYRDLDGQLKVSVSFAFDGPIETEIRRFEMTSEELEAYAKSTYDTLFNAAMAAQEPMTNDELIERMG